MDDSLKHKVAQFIQASQDLLEKQAAENADLVAQNAGLTEQLRVQKEASQKVALPVALPPENVANLADNVIRAGFIKEASREDFINATLNDPFKMVSFIGNLADVTIQHNGLPILGASVNKEASETANKGQSASDIAYETSIRKLSQKM